MPVYVTERRYNGMHPVRVHEKDGRPNPQCHSISQTVEDCEECGLRAGREMARVGGNFACSIGSSGIFPINYFTEIEIHIVYLLARISRTN
jgi:hypothetical protein